MTTRTRPPSSSDRPAASARRGRHRRGGLSRRSRRRLFALLVVSGLAFALVGAKLVSIQGVDSTRYTDVGDEQSLREVTLPALRGSILASNGDELALSEIRDTIYADPDEVTDATAEATTLAPVLHQRASALEGDMTEHTTYVPLYTGATDSLGDAVTKLDLPGIGVDQEPERFYPAGTLAAPIIGGVSSGGQGNSGLEYEYNNVLTGKSGKLVESVDPSGRPVAGGVSEDVPAVDGDDIVTTINEALQYQTEQALSKAIVGTRATSAIAIVMDRQTGDLLSVADLSAGPDDTAVESSKAAAFTNVYQPGSVAKLVTIAGALNRGIISPETVLDVPSQLVVDGTSISDSEPHPDEQLSVTGVLAQSSNIGAAEIGERLGASELYHYEEAFGFTKRTAVHFPAQSWGIVPTPSHFSGTTLATMAFGEAQAVTAAQVVAAYNTIANGGVYVAPRLVTATVGPNGDDHALRYPADRRVVPASVAADMTPMFEQVVSSGTGTAAKVSGYAIAGKTGTSNVIDTNGKYSSSVTESTFAGFYPAQDPVLSEIVVVDGSTLYGAEAAAPVFSTIAHDALLDLGISSDGPQPAAEDTAVPTVDGQVETSLLGQ